MVLPTLSMHQMYQLILNGNQITVDAISAIYDTNCQLFMYLILIPIIQLFDANRLVTVVFVMMQIV